MDASISASLGAMGSLIGKLNLLLEASKDDPGDLRRRLLPKEDGIQLLKEDLEEISIYLEDLSEADDLPLTAKSWMREVRELSYDIEDYIDSFARPGRASNANTRLCKVRHVEVTHLPKKMLTHKRVADKISEFRIRAQDANERYERYELDCHNFRRKYVPVGPMIPTPYQEGAAADLVIDGQMRELIDTIARDNRDHHLNVVSVVGSGGLGKTTLVRVLYNKIKGQFQFRTFIRMTQNRNVKTVLQEILTQVQRQQHHEHREDLDLISEIRDCLQDKRYLIIIDDLWSASVWNIINHALPEGRKRSRVIITTQVEDVALTCCNYHSEFVLEMRPLDFFHSRKLFFNRVFGSESDCPDTFKEVSNKIVEKCSGSPLAIISMASLLASRPVVLSEQLTYISDSLSSNLRTSSTSEGMRRVLNLSYNNLTHFLKTCLLYLTMYPEGYTISKDDLVNQWVAEGFIAAAEGRELERVAGSYLDELIDRRFIQPARIKYNNVMVSCTVHDIVHDLIAYKSSEENFVMVIDNYRKNVELCDNVHRLSLQFVDSKHAKKPGNIRTSQVRSFSFFGFFMCMPNIKEFKLLRVLNIQLYDHHGDDIFDLTGISELFHLRYLKVAGDVCIELPKRMRNLEYMETLDIETKVTSVPWDIIHLPCLLHLHLPFETNLMDWIGSMRSECIQELGKLTNLSYLRLTFLTTPSPAYLEHNLEALGSLLVGLENLKTLALVPGSSHGYAVAGSPSKVTIFWEGFTPSLPLQRFEWSPCTCAFSRVPKWVREFGNLSILKIVVKELIRDGVDILKGLPALITLSLYVHAAPSERIVIDKAGFSVLKYFKFRCCAPWLEFEVDAMPNLWKLKLGFNAHRVDQHITRISIAHLPGLKEITVKIGGAGADTESALMDAVISHPCNPQINIQLVDWVFYVDKVRSTMTEKKEGGKIEQQDDIMDETGNEVSREGMKKEKEQDQQGRIEHDDIMEDTEYLISGKDEDENRKSRERKRRRIEQEAHVMEQMEDEVSIEDANKQVDISNDTPSPHLPISDIEKILMEAQYRWLHPAEVCEIIKNYQNFRIAPEPPNRPPSGSLFLFDRKVLRYFRNDGYNWRKKNDKKTVVELHERLKSGNTNVLDCYYAQGEENTNFQRRISCMLENDFMHIVLVHYLDTKKGDARKERQDDIIDETGNEVSRELMNKQTEQEQLGSIEHHVIMEDTAYLTSGKDEDENQKTRERKPTIIEEEADILEQTEDKVSMKDGNKQVDISNDTPSSHLPISDIEKILMEAQCRWLHPAEVCEIIKNYQNFRIAPEPPNRPPSGSLFLFDRKVLRYFRKDGYNWRKKNDKKTVREHHERLKSGNTDVLCYYAQGEENTNFQRRTSWMFELDFMHIVLVHYLDTKGGKPCKPMRNNNMFQKEDIFSGGSVTGSSVFSSCTSASSIGNYPGLHSTAQSTSFCPSSQDIQLENRHVKLPIQIPVPHEPYTSMEDWGVNSLTFDEVTSSGLSLKDIGAAGVDRESFWQFSSATSDLSTIDNTFPQQNDGFLETAIGDPILKIQSFNVSDTQKNTSKSSDSFTRWMKKELGEVEVSQIQSSSGVHWSNEESGNAIETSSHELLDQSSNLSDILKDSFKKTDSFTRWMRKELPEVEDSQLQSSSGAHWGSEEEDSIIEASSCEPLDQFTVSPMLSQDKLFSIVDFAPSWTYVGSKTKILVTGSILNTSQVTGRCKWSCMFGEIEVPAKILADGTLICYSPQHKPGRVLFYITCSNRLACSEVREFEFRSTDTQYMDAPSPHGATNKVYFQIRLDKLLSLGPDEYQATVSNPSLEMIELSKKIRSLMMSNDEWSNLLKLAVDNELSIDDQQDQFAEKLHVWLLNKVRLGGKGPSVLDDEGQGVLHLAAALGYDWAIRPTLAAGVNINFRDVHGWTALHWAAFCGRERTVVALISLGAAPGALTDPSPEFPESTPADLASANGQKGISGFLAESSLTSHLQALNLKEANMAEISGLPGIGDVTERDSMQPPSGDSLGPVRNATQAAARIYQVFRVQSFQRKQAAQYEDDKGGMSDERALSLLSVKPSKPGQLNPLHSAATRIQNKFRGWKGRKEFLLIRQRIVNIQAHVRGHQVRKHYRKIVWSIGIVEKVILRWRRRGAGLRGFRSTEGSTEGGSSGTSSSLIQDKPSGDDYNFLQEGRKKTEERLQKALARVKSMAQYPEARDQYQRILTVVTKMQESQAMQEKMLEESAEMDDGYLMNELQELWDDDTPIPGYF